MLASKGIYIFPFFFFPSGWKAASETLKIFLLILSLLPSNLHPKESPRKNTREASLLPQNHLTRHSRVRACLPRTHPSSELHLW